VAIDWENYPGKSIQLSMVNGSAAIRSRARRAAKPGLALPLGSGNVTGDRYRRALPSAPAGSESQKPSWNGFLTPSIGVTTGDRPGTGLGLVIVNAASICTAAKSKSKANQTQGPQ